MELTGIIIEIINNSFGYIKSNNDYYYFDKSDFLENFDLKENIEVIFKPIIVNNIKRAVLIEKK